MLDDLDIRSRLTAIYDEEVVPGFGRRSLGIEAARYVAATFERLMNPFLDHRLADIAQNHPVKLRNRIQAFFEWVRQRDAGFVAPRLGAIVVQNSDDRAEKRLAR
jgi:tagaturonate reductase